MLYTLSILLIIIASFLLILIVLVQNPKGGGLASGFTGANQFGGVAQTNKFLEKSTWTLAIVILLFSFIGTVSIPREKEKKSVLTESVKNIDFTQNPVNPTNINIPTTTTVPKHNNK